MLRFYLTNVLWASGIGVLLLGTVPVCAQAGTLPVAMPLTALSQGKKVTVLRQGHDIAQLTWKVQPHHEDDNPAIQIRYLTSPDTPVGSQLVVSVDHKIVGAVRLNPKLPRGSFTVLLGHRAFTAGSYPIAIQAILGPVVSKTLAAEAWTQVDYSSSQIRYTPKPIPWKHLDFGHMPTILSEAATGGHLLLPVRFYGPKDPAMLTAAQEAVAGLALRTKNVLHVDVQMPSSSSVLAKNTPAKLSVVIGKASDLPTDLLPHRPVETPTVYLIPDPANRVGAVLVFTGANNAQILEAASAFAMNRKMLPLGHRWDVTSGDQLASMHLGPENGLYPDQLMPISNLQGMQSTLSKPRGTAVIRFWMPGGLFASRQSRLKMKLTMATEPLRATTDHPIITVMANHHWISRWKLTPGVANYQTTIPFSALVGGENQIRFDIAGGKVAVFPDSTLELPRTHRYAVLPNLRLFAHTGFPLVANGAARNLVIWYSQRTATNWSAGLTLFSKIAQAAHSPLAGAQATFSMPNKKNALAIGTVESIPATWLANSAVRFIQNRIQWQLGSLSGKQKTWVGASLFPSTAYLTEARTPYENGVAVTFLSTKSQYLKSAAWNLADRASWNSLHGDFARQQLHGTYQSTMVGRHFIYGNRQNDWFWIFLFSKKPWFWVLTGLSAVLLATFAVWIFTLRKKAQWRAEDAL